MLLSKLARPSCRCVSRRISTVPVRPNAASRILTRPRQFTQSRPLRSSQDPYHNLRNARPLVSNSAASRFTSAGRGRNSQAVVGIAVVAAVAFYFYNSQTVPVTGRRRFNFLSDKLVEKAHGRAVEAVIQSVQEQGGRFLSDWDPRTILVKRVMKRLIPVSGLPDLNWEIRVIADDSECLVTRPQQR